MARVGGWRTKLGCVVALAAALLALGCASSTRYRHVLDVAPDGYRLLMAKADLLQLYDIEKEQRVWRRRLEHRWFEKIEVTWSRGGAYFALEGGGQCAVWERESGRRISPIFAASEVEDVAVSSDGRWLALGRRKNVSVYDALSGKLLLQVPDRSVSFAWDAALLATREHLFELRDSRWQELATLPKDVRDRAWVGRRLALALEGSIEIWDGGKPTQRLVTRGPVELVSDARLLAIIEPTVLKDFKYYPHLERLTVYDVETGKTRFVREDLGAALDVEFRDGQLFVAGFRAEPGHAFHSGSELIVVELDVRSGRSLRGQDIDWCRPGLSHCAELLRGARYFRYQDYVRELRYQKLQLREHR